MAKPIVARPTREELADCLSSTTLPQLSLLMSMWNAQSMPLLADGTPLPTLVVVTAALFDWLTAHQAFAEAERFSVLSSVRPPLSAYADCYDEDEKAGEGHTPATFAVIDGTFVAIRVAGTPLRAYLMYNVKTGAEIDGLPQHALTSLSCDLNVLLLRLFGRLNKVRQQKEQGCHDLSINRQPLPVPRHKP